MFSKLLLCLAMATVATVGATEQLELKEEYGEARLLDGVFNNTSIDLNSILALVLIGILALVTIGPNFLGGSSSYNRGGYEYSDYGGYGDQQFYKRSDANVDNLAGKMYQLEQAFKKYEVNEIECRMYVACEASQVDRLEENGPLAKIVFDILSKGRNNEEKLDSDLEGLTQSFEYGSAALQYGKVDGCQPLRNKCFELHSKKSY